MTNAVPSERRLGAWLVYATSAAGSPALVAWRASCALSGRLAPRSATAAREGSAARRCSRSPCPTPTAASRALAPVARQGAGRQLLGDLVRAVPRGDARVRAAQSELGGKGLQFVGIAIDDADKVRRFAAEIGLNYPALIGGYGAMELSKTLGNSADGAAVHGHRRPRRQRRPHPAGPAPENCANLRPIVVAICSEARYGHMTIDDS